MDIGIGTVKVADPDVMTVMEGELPVPVETGIDTVNVADPDVMTVTEG